MYPITGYISETTIVMIDGTYEFNSLDFKSGVAGNVFPDVCINLTENNVCGENKSFNSEDSSFYYSIMSTIIGSLNPLTQG